MKRHKNNNRSQDGQSLVEFTASLVVLMLILSGVVDIGRAFFSFVAIENAAGEGALFAAYHPTWLTEDDSSSATPEYDNITYRAAHESPSGVVDWAKTSISIDSPQLELGQPITVSVTYSYTVLTPFINLIIGGSDLPLRADATQIILSVD